MARTNVQSPVWFLEQKINDYSGNAVGESIAQKSDDQTGYTVDALLKIGFSADTEGTEPYLIRSHYFMVCKVPEFATLPSQLHFWMQGQLAQTTNRSLGQRIRVFDWDGVGTPDYSMVTNEIIGSSDYYITIPDEYKNRLQIGHSNQIKWILYEFVRDCTQQGAAYRTFQDGPEPEDADVWFDDGSWTNNNFEIVDNNPGLKRRRKTVIIF